MSPVCSGRGQKGSSGLAFACRECCCFATATGGREGAGITRGNWSVGFHQARHRAPPHYILFWRQAFWFSQLQRIQSLFCAASSPSQDTTAPDKDAHQIPWPLSLQREFYPEVRQTKYPAKLMQAVGRRIPTSEGCGHSRFLHSKPLAASLRRQQPTPFAAVRRGVTLPWDPIDQAALKPLVRSSQCLMTTKLQSAVPQAPPSCAST